MKRALLLALLTTGCSALGLTDGLDQEGCTSCADLNAIDPPPACMSWQCIDGFCALDVEDLDEDGVPSAMCVPDDVPSDCDEADPEIGESFDEACDGKDNDCDERVDESLFRREVYAELPDVEALSLAPHDSGLSAIFARRSAEDGLRVLRRFRTDDPVEHIETIAEDYAAPIVARDTALAAEDDDSGVLEVAFVPRGGSCPRALAGRWRAGDPLALIDQHRVDTDVGLPKLGGSCPGDTSPVGDLAVASVRDAALLLWREVDAGPPTCPSTRSPVGALLLRDGVQGAPTGLGESVGPPVVIGLDESRGLAALPTDGAIELHLVTIDIRLGIVDVALVASEPCEGEACVDLSLARWVSRDGSRVGLAYRTGGCGDAAVRLRRWDPETWEALDASPLEVTEAGAIGRVALAARAEGGGWGVAWATEATVSARLFDDDGQPVTGALPIDVSAPITAALAASWPTSGVTRGFTVAYHDPGPASELVQAHLSERLCGAF
ncbi:MAG: putative metal-binding motif-containing protein [Myxococcota bacterium]|nr:putative metal-binding motif-containing protein [Myxococcota bacterium]